MGSCERIFRCAKFECGGFSPSGRLVPISHRIGHWSQPFVLKASVSTHVLSLLPFYPFPVFFVPLERRALVVPSSLEGWLTLRGYKPLNSFFGN